jgi:hypothetical protein
MFANDNLDYDQQTLALLRKNRADWLAYNPPSALESTRRKRMLQRIASIEARIIVRNC